MLAVFNPLSSEGQANERLTVSWPSGIPKLILADKFVEADLVIFREWALSLFEQLCLTSPSKCKWWKGSRKAVDVQAYTCCSLKPRLVFTLILALGQPADSFTRHMMAGMRGGQKGRGRALRRGGGGRGGQVLKRGCYSFLSTSLSWLGLISVSFALYCCVASLPSLTWHF